MIIKTILFHLIKQFVSKTIYIIANIKLCEYDQDIYIYIYAYN